MNNVLTLEQIIARTGKRNPRDLEPLLKYLDFRPEGPMGGEVTAREIALYLRKAGSNDIVTLLRMGEPVEYAAVLRDVAKKMKLEPQGDETEPDLEARLLKKTFEDAWDIMSEAERRALLESMNLKVGDIPFGATGTIVTGLLLKNLGGFAVYRTALIVGNLVAKALLGTGLSFATNVAMTRTIGALLGPLGLIASGAWLAFDLAGPAFRKTVPAVLYVALLRQLLINRVNIGIVGDASTGKDALIRNVFKLKSDVNPIAGSTASAVTYAVGNGGVLEVINYPGFNDYRESVNQQTDEQLHHTDVFIFVVDCLRGVSGTDVEIMKRLRKFNQPILVCMNKLDLIRGEDQRKALEKAALERLSVHRGDLIFTAFDPDDRLMKTAIGRLEALDWLRAQLTAAGKGSGATELPQ